MKKFLQNCLGLFFFLLPWQTIYITQEAFFNAAKWEYGTLGFYATEIILWICIISFFLLYSRNFLQQKEKIQFSWTRDRIFVASILLFLLYCFSSIIWSLNKPVALQQSFHLTEAFLLFLAFIVSSLDFKRIAKWFVAGAVLQSILGLYQFLSQSTFACKWLGLVAHPVAQAGSSVVVGDSVGRVLRAYGAFSHPNVFGGYLAIAIFITLFLFFQEKKNKIWILVLFFEFLALFFTMSRSAWISVSLAGVFLGAYFVKTKKLENLPIFGACFVLSLTLSVIYSPLVFTRFAHQSSHEIQSTEERVEGIKEGIRLWKTAPFFGVGAGNYTAASYKINPTRPGYEYQPVHSVPLLVLTELGMVGVLLLGGVFLTFWQYIKQTSLSRYKYIYFVGSIIFLSLFDHYLFSSYVGLVLSALYFGFIFHFSLCEAKK